MRKIVLFVLVCNCLFITANAQDYLNVLTFNIRYNNAGDSLNAWPYRKDHAASQVLFHQAHIVGIQEALYGQMQDMQERLPGYKYIGVGRDDGKQKGEFSSIFIDTTRLQVINWQTFWLAEKTDVPGIKGWDAAITRIVTWAKVKDRKTKKSFFIFNTHFDHMGQVARKESAKLLIQKVKEIAGSAPVIVTGDFNAKPDDEPIMVIMDKSNPLHLTDSKEISRMPHYGPTGTFNAFRSKETDDKPIDYIFIKNGVQVLQHATFSQTWQGRFSSDHFPVFARLQVK
jgi:endonuclease/exonuclease/phosphatase family metal-dependent hydrolase